MQEGPDVVKLVAHVVEDELILVYIIEVKALNVLASGLRLYIDGVCLNESCCEA